MPNVDRKWLPLVLIGLAAVASLLAYGRLPAMVDLRLEGMLPFETSEAADPVPRWVALSLVPALALLLWAGFRAAPTAAGERVARRLFRRAPSDVTSREQFERFGKSYDAIVLGVVMLVLGVHAAIIAGALGYAGAAVRIVPMVLGATLILMGNVMPRLRPNWVAGIRMAAHLRRPTALAQHAPRVRCRVRRVGIPNDGRRPCRSSVWAGHRHRVAVRVVRRRICRLDAAASERTGTCRSSLTTRPRSGTLTEAFRAPPVRGEDRVHLFG